jgi:hypothetical protein
MLRSRADDIAPLELAHRVLRVEWPEGEPMRFAELAFVGLAAAALVVWRGLAMYRQTFHRDRL